MRATAAAFVRDTVRPRRRGLGARPRLPARGRRRIRAHRPLLPARELGGAALGFPDGMEVFEELGRGDAALAFSLSMHNAVAAAVAGCEDAGLRARWARRPGRRQGAGRVLADRAAGRLGRDGDHDPGPTATATAGGSPGARRGSRWPARPTSSWSSARRRAAPGPRRHRARSRSTPPRPGSASRCATARRRRPSCRSARCSSPTRRRCSSRRRARGCGRRSAPSTSPAATSPRSRAACTPRRSTSPCAMPASGTPSAGRCSRSTRCASRSPTCSPTSRRAGCSTPGRRRCWGRPPGRRRRPTRSGSAPTPPLRAAIACSEALGAYGWLERHAAAALHQPGQDAAGRRRDGRDPAARDRPRARRGWPPTASSRSPRGETFSRNFLNSSTTSPGLLRLLAELDRRVVDHLVGDEDLGVGPHGQRERVGRARVDLDLRAVDAQRDGRVEGVVAQLGHRDLLDLRVQLAQHRRDQVVRHRPRRRRALELHQDRGRLGVADPDRAGTCCRRASGGARSAACRPCRRTPRRCSSPASSGPV